MRLWLFEDDHRMETVSEERVVLEVALFLSFFHLEATVLVSTGLGLLRLCTVFAVRGWRRTGQIGIAASTTASWRRFAYPNPSVSRRFASTIKAIRGQQELEHPCQKRVVNCRCREERDTARYSIGQFRQAIGDRPCRHDRTDKAAEAASQVL